MMNCENCNSPHNGEYGSGRFCSVKCARSSSTKNKRAIINERVSLSLTGRGKTIEKLCPICENKFVVKWNRRKKETCSKICSSKKRWMNLEYRETRINEAKQRSATLEARIRLREIGRKGGFGTKGITRGGTQYQSLLEKKCFEFLEENKIEFIPHRSIPNSAKISDVYLVALDLWIELDGIDREKRKKWIGKDYEYWLEKLKIYDREKLKYKIAKTFDEFKIMVS